MRALLIILLAISLANGYVKTNCSHYKSAAVSESNKMRNSGLSDRIGQKAIFNATMYNACEQENTRNALEELIKILKEKGENK